MSWVTLAILYGGAGLLTTAVTVHTFRPRDGYRPGLATIVTAVVTFTLLWPVLVALLVWYRGMTFAQRTFARLRRVQLIADWSSRIAPGNPTALRNQLGDQPVETMLHADYHALAGPHQTDLSGSSPRSSSGRLPLREGKFQRPRKTK